jgi:hypothetical protein
MKIENIVATGIVAAAFLAKPGFPSTLPDGTSITARVIITALPIFGGHPPGLDAGDVAILQAKTPSPVVELKRLAGNLSDMQLFVFLDDSTRSASLGTHLPELKEFLKSLPSTTQVAIGYMRNGTSHWYNHSPGTTTKQPPPSVSRNRCLAPMAARTLRCRTWRGIGPPSSRATAERC